MKILFLIQSVIPRVKHDDYFPILMRTLQSIREQNPCSNVEIEVALSDDGSDYLATYASDKMKLISQNKTLDEINKKFNLNIDHLVLIAENNKYLKADLFNYFFKHNTTKYDLVVILDDDHPFIFKDTLTRLYNHHRKGYNFIVGRIVNPNKKFRSYLDNTVQGSTFILSGQLLKDINYFGERVKIWGCGEDTEAFWRVYLQYKKGNVKGIYDGNIMTIDSLSGRWMYCHIEAGGIELFRKDFYETYGVNPHNNKSRIKQNWLDYSEDRYGIKEKYFLFVTLDDYFNFNKSKLICNLKWGILYFIDKYLYPIKKIYGRIKRKIISKKK